MDIAELLLIAAMVLLSLAGGAQADLCAQGSKEIDGNWFCQPVKAIQYSNVGTPGVYNQITDMTAAGTCSHQPKAFSGPIAPLDEEVSLHFRGPLHLKQLAAYAPSSSAAKKRSSKLEKALLESRSEQYHNHLQKHKGRQGSGAKDERQEVTATINGQVVSWQNNYFGPSAEPVVATLSTKASGAVTTSSVNPVVGQPSPAAPVHITSPTTSARLSQASGPVDATMVFDRIAYYDSESQTADNIAFLGNFGGQGSGVFDYVFGASVSYINCSGTGGAASPEILADTVIPSDVEVIVMLGEACSNGSCGFVRPGAVAHHGFDGADKMFLIEFSMPMDGKTAFNGDMPAIWMLNAEIVHTLQYGEASCSCWESGCGEFDIAEALSTGSTYLKSTLHTNAPGGDSDYLVRPTDSTMKLAVVFSSSSATIHIQVLPDDTEFGTSLHADQVNSMCAAEADQSVSYFTVA